MLPLFAISGELYSRTPHLRMKIAVCPVVK
jgi:hypothetical protein